jgi:hypothetical protein
MDGGVIGEFIVVNVVSEKNWLSLIESVNFCFLLFQWLFEHIDP